MPDQDTKPTPIQDMTQPFNFGKWLRIALIMVPVIVVIVIVLLVLFQPSTNTIYYNITEIL